MRSTCHFLLAALAIAACASRVVQPSVRVVPVGRLVVTADGSTRFLTISAALDSARDGDTVFIMPGVYREAVRIAGPRRVTLLGADPATTIVDATDQYAAIELRTDSNRVSRLTIRGADSHGIWVRDGQQYIDHCVVVDNGDRGVYLSSFAGHAYADIRHCTVAQNVDVGIHAARDDSNTVITNCIIAFNGRGVVTDQPEGKLVVRRSCFFGNEVNFDRIAPDSGHILRDPLFKSRDRGYFCLKKQFPCIGSGDGGTNLGAL